MGAIEVWLAVPAVVAALAAVVSRWTRAPRWVPVTLWVASLVGTVVLATGLALSVAFVQTVVGATRAAVEGDPDGARGHVDLRVLVPWVSATAAVVVGSGIVVSRRPSRAAP